MKAEIDSNCIVTETEKAYLIKVPGANYAFWHPKRFCEIKGKNGYLLSIWFGDGFTGKFFKHETKTKVAVGEMPLEEVLEDYLV